MFRTEAGCGAKPGMTDEKWLRAARSRLLSAARRRSKAVIPHYRHPFRHSRDPKGGRRPKREPISWPCVQHGTAEMDPRLRGHDDGERPLRYPPCPAAPHPQLFFLVGLSPIHPAGWNRSVVHSLAPTVFLCAKRNAVQARTGCSESTLGAGRGGFGGAWAGNADNGVKSPLSLQWRAPSFHRSLRPLVRQM